MEYEVVVIGGGIVGLATAYKILEKKPGVKLALLEKESGVAKHQTGNNSGVIHSGIYYKPGSLKAKNCISGYQRLLAFCDEHEIEYDLCGKVIVATSEAEKIPLENIYNRGLKNGLGKIRKISQAELREIEPHVAGIAGIDVPYTGIVDFKQVSAKYAELIQEKGGEIITGAKVINIKRHNRYSEIITIDKTYTTKLAINCAGLYSDKIAGFCSEKLDVRIIPFRGEYYEIVPEKHHLVKNLIYPVPDPNFPFLGVHFTRMIGGGIEAGPNAVFAFKREGYSKMAFNFTEFAESITWPGFQKVAVKYWQTGIGEFYRSFSKKAFTKALQKLIPEIQEEDLVPGGAGVRAQACDRSGGLIDDFKIVETEHVINVLNAPSPAATSSLAIGSTVSKLAIHHLNE
ncbi:L-2-hydroxyglutarate oxidase [Flammeovirgaceae bacterium SG7u.111]|nr:L-2-hydroxyglutarate oxidase [Flammeovirgaceae bacterium SG7u.132]WPO35103.1 L-2-hydroxyglutarate oxidase [Flammeovirgaceae bacterium SG7u.111]